MMAAGAARVDRPAVGAADARSSVLRAAADDDAHKFLHTACSQQAIFYNVIDYLQQVISVGAIG